MSEWKDITTYRQDDKIRIPRAYLISLGKVRLKVHRHVSWPEDVWLLSCSLFPITALISREIDKAKWEAINMAESVLLKSLKEIRLFRESNQ